MSEGQVTGQERLDRRVHRVRRVRRDRGGDGPVGVDDAVAQARVVLPVAAVERGQQPGDDLPARQRRVLRPLEGDDGRGDRRGLAGPVPGIGRPGHPAQRRDADAGCGQGQVGVAGGERRHRAGLVDRPDGHHAEAHTGLLHPAARLAAVARRGEQHGAPAQRVVDGLLLGAWARLAVVGRRAAAAQRHADHLAAVVGRVPDRLGEVVIGAGIGSTYERHRDGQQLGARGDAADAEQPRLPDHDRGHRGAVPEVADVAVDAPVPRLPEVGAGKHVARELGQACVHAGVDLGNRDALAPRARGPQLRDLPAVEPVLRRVGRAGGGGRGDGCGD